MSTTVNTDSDRDEFSLFNHHIENSFEICRNCFARTHIVHETFAPQDLPKSLRGVVKADIERTTDAMTDYHPSLPAANCRRTMCGSCGSDRNLVLKRPVKTSTALSYAQNLTERVYESKELSLDDDDSLIEEVERLKTEGNHNRDNNYLFSKAFNNVVDVDLTDE